MEIVELRGIKEGFLEAKNKIKEYLGKIGELEAKFQDNIINSRTNEIKNKLLPKLISEFEDVKGYRQIPQNCREEWEKTKRSDC